MSVAEGVIQERTEFAGPSQGLQFHGVLGHGLTRLLIALIKAKPFSNHKSKMRCEQGTEFSICLFSDGTGSDKLDLFCTL